MAQGSNLTSWVRRLSSLIGGGKQSHGHEGQSLIGGGRQSQIQGAEDRPGKQQQ